MVEKKRRLTQGEDIDVRIKIPRWCYRKYMQFKSQATTVFYDFDTELSKSIRTSIFLLLRLQMELKLRMLGDGVSENEGLTLRSHHTNVDVNPVMEYTFLNFWDIGNRCVSLQSHAVRVYAILLTKREELLLRVVFAFP